MFEMLIVIGFALVARAVLRSIMRSIAKTSSDAFQNRQSGAAGSPEGSNSRRAAAPQTEASGELHKDPVCGTYVSGATNLRRQIGAQTYYYCSEACREKHEMVAR